LDLFGPKEKCSKEKGPKEKGSNEKGPKEKGPNEKGPNEKGPNEKGPKEKDPSEKGSNEKGGPFLLNIFFFGPFHYYFVSSNFSYRRLMVFSVLDANDKIDTC
jgi:hypothetical protein